MWIGVGRPCFCQPRVLVGVQSAGAVEAMGSGRRTARMNVPMQQLLLVDEAELPDAVDEAEAALAATLGSMGLRRSDDGLRKQATDIWLKVARAAGEGVGRGRL